MDKSSFKQDNEINENMADNANVDKTSKGIKFKVYSETKAMMNQKANENKNAEGGEKAEGEQKDKYAIEDQISVSEYDKIKNPARTFDFPLDDFQKRGITEQVY